ncbi:MAG: ATPase, T2SS/T4P/T4SS family [Peptostreptococcales bacterium]
MESRKFLIEEYLSHRTMNDPRIHEYKECRFYGICNRVKESFQEEWEESSTEYERILLEHKKAIMGYKKEVAYFKDKIQDYLRENNLMNEGYPSWYESLSDAIYNEIWGMGGVSEWFTSKYKDSGSAKIIGNRIYFLINGQSVLMPQPMKDDKRRQLIKFLLLRTPEKRLSESYHEVYMVDGTRISIYTGNLIKENQEVIVFRKFFVKEYTFEKQADMGTIPKEGIGLFKSMIPLGFNIAFTGAVRTAKTTFLATWQSYESPSLEGVMVETDPEIPLHKIMPQVPIIQLVADDKRLEKVSRSILRSDGDYVIMAEARDGAALDIALRAANKGTRRVKITFHTTDVFDFCYDVADEVVRVYGGSFRGTIMKVSKSFQFIFNFIQLKDKSQKRLEGIYTLELENNEIVFRPICKYESAGDRWTWKREIGVKVKEMGLREDEGMYAMFEKELDLLSKQFPMVGAGPIHYAYKEL